MSFKYNHTCPVIDRGIKEFKTDIEWALSAMLDECCPMLVEKQKTDFVKVWVDYVYADLENVFESVRNTNEDMRKEAELQIDSIVTDREEEIQELTMRIHELEQQLDESRNMSEELQS